MKRKSDGFLFKNKYTIQKTLQCQATFSYLIVLSLTLQSLLPFESIFIEIPSSLTSESLSETDIVELEEKIDKSFTNCTKY